MKGDTVNIMTYADGHYIQHACVMLLSLKDVVSSKVQYRIFLFYSDCSAEDLNKVRDTLNAHLGDNVSYKMIACDFGLERKLQAKKTYMKASIYNKVLIYDELPSPINKLVFLDADIVLLQDPASLYNIELGDKILAAVQDPVYKNFSETAKRTLEITSEEYFNSGVMVVNLQAWRKNNVSARSLEFCTEKWNLTPLHDQDAFNYVINGNWVELSPLWNPRTKNKIKKNTEIKILSRKEVYEQNEAYLIHYCGADKPWNYISFHPAGKYYRKYLKLSAFSDYTYPDFNFKNFVKKQIMKLRLKFYYWRKANIGM